MSFFTFIELVGVGTLVFCAALITVTCIFHAKASKIEKLEEAEAKAKKEQQLISQNK